MHLTIPRRVGDGVRLKHPRSCFFLPGMFKIISSRRTIGLAIGGEHGPIAPGNSPNRSRPGPEARPAECAIAMEPTVTALVICSLVSSFAAVGGVIAFKKRRRPIEGMTLGLLLGPVGVAVEALLPSVGRPEVCERAWNSFRSMTTYQAAPPRRAGGGRRG